MKRINIQGEEVTLNPIRYSPDDTITISGADYDKHLEYLKSCIDGMSQGGGLAKQMLDEMDADRQAWDAEAVARGAK